MQAIPCLQLQIRINHETILGRRSQREKGRLHGVRHAGLKLVNFFGTATDDHGCFQAHEVLDDDRSHLGDSMRLQMLTFKIEARANPDFSYLYARAAGHSCIDPENGCIHSLSLHDALSAVKSVKG